MARLSAHGTLHAVYATDRSRRLRKTTAAQRLVVARSDSKICAVGCAADRWQVDPVGHAE